MPVAGSAYTFSYTSLGELVAWIIGWDLMLELAFGASTVASGWSQYFQVVLTVGAVSRASAGVDLRRITTTWWLRRSSCCSRVCCASGVRTSSARQRR